MVESGRLAFVNFGEDYGTPVMIVDWADSKRILVEGEKFPRCLYPLRRLTLTKVKIDLNRGARSGAVKKAWAAQKVNDKWALTPAAKKLDVKSKRANLDDMQRFSVMINRKQRAHAVRKLVSKQIKPKKAAPKGKGKGKKWAISSIWHFESTLKHLVLMVPHTQLDPQSLRVQNQQSQVLQTMPC